MPEQEIVYVLHIKTDCGSESEINVYKTYDKAVNAFFTEVGRSVIHENINPAGEATDFKIEFAKFTMDPASHRVAYYASEGYETEIFLRKDVLK